MPNADYEKMYGKGPHVTVDNLVVWCGMILLIKRQDNTWALPGGFVEPGEQLLDAAIRELIEETSLQPFITTNPCYLDSYRKEVLKDSFEYVFYNADPERDPRSHIVTFVHVYHLPMRFNTIIKAADDAKHVEWVKVTDLFEKKEFGAFVPKEHSYVFYADHAKLLYEGYKHRNYATFRERLND